MITFTNLTGAEEIGANCYHLDIDGAQVVLDCGMHPKREGLAAQPQFNLIKEDALDAIFLTHSHLDHLGTLPVLQMQQPTAQVFMTIGTASVAEAMLHNSVNVMTSKRTEEGIVDYPFFTHTEVDTIVDSWQVREYNETFSVGPRNEVHATLFDAGHILGSAGVYLETARGHSIFYTGDVQFEDQSMIPGADFPENGVDTLIMECTRGSAARSTHYRREDELERFAQSIVRTLERGGAVLVPVFALGKSQEMLYNIHRFKQEGIIPAKTPIYFGGLSSKVTSIYDKLSDDTPRLTPGFRLKQEVDITPLPRKGNKQIKCEPGNIYLVSGGMMTEKTAAHSMAEQLLENKKNSILFVGYCDPDSPAGWLRMAPEGESVCLREKGGQSYRKNCQIESFDFSGHAPREALLSYAKVLKPKRVILVHGDPDAIEWMAEHIQNVLPNSEVVTPQAGETYTFS